MKNLLLCVFIILMSGQLFAQSQQVSGNITDTSSKQKLVNASVVLLRGKDSVLYKFTRSDTDGNFAFSRLDTGKYFLLITEKNYVDYVENFLVKDSSVSIRLGSIFMTLKANLLNEVIVRQQIAAIRIKGDTTEYTADSFKVRPGASVEDMLRVLPGLQVDKDGKITAQGKTIKKVLVDGEEFFGDDPTLATKNLQADAIDKVQVFDKKSDQATFSGIDDGEKTPTINLKLKADKKKGYFGKVDLASNFKDRWNNTLMLNDFKAKTKISAYGIISNTGKSGLDWSEQNKYGSGGNSYDEDFGGNYDEYSDGTYNGEGLPKTWSAGLNYGNKWNDDKQNLNGSYRYNKLNTEGSESTVSQSLLPGDNYFINRENSYSFNSSERHSINGIYEWQMDSSTSSKVIASGYSGSSRMESIYNTTNTNAAGFDVNKTNRITTSNGDNQNLNVSAIFRKKFKKMGRTLSMNVNEIYNDNSSTGFLKANVSYNDPKTGSFVKDSITNQMKVNDNRVNTFIAKAIYSEPLTKRLFLVANYSIRTNTSDSKRLSFDSSNNGKYESLNPLYSNHYQFDVLTHTTGIAFRYTGKKLTASAGSDIGFTNFYQKDLLLDTAYSRNYTNFFPTANINYKFNTNTRLNIYYNGRTSQPSITQIQPVKDNTDPLFQYMGNASLKQSFTHQLSLNFNKYDVFKERGLSFYSSFGTTAHAIVTNNFTDTTTGVTTLQYINASGNYNYNANFYVNGKIKKLNLYLNAGAGFSGSQYSNIVNDVKNVSKNNVPSINVGLYKYKEKKFSVWYNYTYSYNFSKSTIQSGFTTNYWTQFHQIGANVQLPWKMEVNADGNYNLRQKTDVFTTNNNVFLLNAYIGRHLLKNDKAIIKITANDILNQNQGFSRDVRSNTLTERNYQTIRRYFMLAFTWNFTKSAAGVTTPSN